MRYAKRKSDNTTQNKSDVHEWINWSLTKHTEDEIREKCLTDFNNVCFTFVCNTSKMSEEFIEELMVLSTGILTKENYADIYDKLHTTVLENAGVIPRKSERWYIDIHETALGYDSDKSKTISSTTILDRMDWAGISKNQKLSEDFIRKFSELLSWKEIRASQSLSKEFIEEFKHELSN